MCTETIIKKDMSDTEKMLHDCAEMQKCITRTPLPPRKFTVSDIKGPLAESITLAENNGGLTFSHLSPFCMKSNCLGSFHLCQHDPECISLVECVELHLESSSLMGMTSQCTSHLNKLDKKESMLLKCGMKHGCMEMAPVDKRIGSLFKEKISMYEKQKYDEAYRHYKSVEAMAENSILHPTEDISSPASFLQVDTKVIREAQSKINSAFSQIKVKGTELAKVMAESDKQYQESRRKADYLLKSVRAQIDAINKDMKASHQRELEDRRLLQESEDREKEAAAETEKKIKEIREKMTGPAQAPVSSLLESNSDFVMNLKNAAEKARLVMANLAKEKIVEDNFLRSSVIPGQAEASSKTFTDGMVKLADEVSREPSFLQTSSSSDDQQQNLVADIFDTKHDPFLNLDLEKMDAEFKKSYKKALDLIEKYTPKPHVSLVQVDHQKSSDLDQPGLLFFNSDFQSPFLNKDVKKLDEEFRKSLDVLKAQNKEILDQAQNQLDRSSALKAELLSEQERAVQSARRRQQLEDSQLFQSSSSSSLLEKPVPLFTMAKTDFDTPKIKQLTEQLNTFVSKIENNNAEFAEKYQKDQDSLNKDISKLKEDLRQSKIKNEVFRHSLDKKQKKKI